MKNYNSQERDTQKTQTTTMSNAQNVEMNSTQLAAINPPTFQLMEEEEEMLQGKFQNNDSAQLMEEEEELQMKSKSSGTAQLKEEEEELQMKKDDNKTGLPDGLKSGIENLSGVDISDVKVHYNSAEPAQLNAHAYAQGTDIHVASGQEKHLAHEAWHVVQQKQGRVKPTTSVGGKNINNDVALEREADVMGAKALQKKTKK